MYNVHFLNVEYLLTALYEFIKNFDPVAIINWLLWFITLLRPIAIFISLILLTISIYSAIRIRQLEIKEKNAEEAMKSEQKETPVEQEKELNEKWSKVQELINSANPNDWRVAILEADIMLAEVLDKAGFHGDTIGDQLKTIEKGDMVTLDSAWEAHKIRNEVAHGGNDFKLNEREAKGTIELYKKVFEEFYHI